MPRDPFYNSRVWKFTRRVKLTANPYCESCKVRLATDVDHIKALTDGGDRTAPGNLRSLCHECHSRKTLYIERMGRDRVPVKGCKPDGTPLDPEHPWNRDTSGQGQSEIVDSEAFQTHPRAISEKTFAVADAKDRARNEKQS